MAKTLQTDDKPYLLTAWQSKPCADCDEKENGMGNRVDCGCVYEVEVAAHKTLRAARMHGGRVAKDGTPVSVSGPDGDLVWSQ